MMNISQIIKKTVIVTVIYCVNAGFVYANETVLNPVQSTYLNNLINTQLKNKSDRDYVNHDWTEAQRVAEFICRPLAQKYIKQQFSEVDKVILDQGRENTQRLISSTHLTGNGQYRIGNDWTPFNYECELSEQTGKALKFRLLNNKNVTMAPGPVIPKKGKTE